MNCWILQCNVNNYRWFDYIKDHKNDLDTWAINRFVKEVQQGDSAFIWLTKYKGKETRGIYALAKITGIPDKRRKPFPYEEPYWIPKEEKQRLSPHHRLELRYTNIIEKDKYISKAELETANLGNLLILRVARGSIYKLTEEETKKIRRLTELQRG